MPLSPREQAERARLSSTGQRSARIASGLASSWPPFLAWLVATTVIVVTCIAEGWPPLDANRTWVRWDAALYLSIARGGYTLTPCGPGLWCGNAGWFPGYPWLVGGLHLLALPLAPTGLAVAWLAWLATLVLVWRAFLSHRPLAEGVIPLAYAAFAPGLVYDYALFPLSLLSLCTVAALALMQRHRWLAAGLAAAIGTLAYPVGAALAPAAALWLLARRGVPLAERLRRVAACAGPSAVALALFTLDQQLETGHWDAYLLVQRKYGHAIQDPFAVVAAAVGTLVHGSAVQLAPGAPVHAIAPALQTLLVAFVLTCILTELALHRHSATEIDALIAIWAVTAWLSSHAAANVSTYRSEAALAPIALLLRRLPRPLAAVIAAGAVLLVVPMTRLYLSTLLF